MGKEETLTHLLGLVEGTRQGSQVCEDELRRILKLLIDAAPRNDLAIIGKMFFDFRAGMESRLESN